jgi:hypothetical protein
MLGRACAQPTLDGWMDNGLPIKMPINNNTEAEECRDLISRMALMSLSATIVFGFFVIILKLAHSLGWRWHTILIPVCAAIIGFVLLALANEEEDAVDALTIDVSNRSTGRSLSREFSKAEVLH